MDNKGNQNKNGKNPRGQNYAVLIMTMLFTLLCVAMMHNLWQGSRTHKMPYSEFNQMLKDHEVESVVIGNGKIQITPKEDSKKYGGSQGKYGNLVGMEYYTIPINDPDLEKKLDEAGVTTYEQAEVDATGSIIMLLLEWVLPIAAMFVIFNMMMKRMGGGGGIMGVGKSNAKVYVQKETGVTFKDVAGEDEAKESLTEIVDFLHNPGKYTKIGAKLPKGALLVGPPGTGKTLLAKAVAGEAKVPFFSLSGSDFVEMFVGVGASRVRDLFKQAQQSAPCIIFIDEVDAIGKSRDSRLGGNDEREQTLNQLLSEMDGFDSSKGLLVMAATNRPEILDPALLRPGRFDRRIIVDKPDLKGRVQILKVHSKDVKLDETVDFEEIALATSGAVGADLANMMNEAAITAVKNGRKAVSQKDLFEAVELVLVGKEKKDRILSQEERRIVSYHEVGHALVSALQKDSEPVQKITIVPRTMGALGYVMQVPEEEKYLNTEKEIRAMLVGFLGGRAAEDKEVMHILKVSYEEAKRLLSENREALDKIAAFLIEKETITGKEFMKIFHEVKGIPELEEKKQEGEDRIEMPEAAKTRDEVQPVKTAEETNAENSQNQQKLEGKPADEAPADETPESAEAVAAESPNEDEMRGGSSFDRK